MKQLSFFLFSICIHAAATAQCNAFWTASAQGTEVLFTNLSAVPNAKCFWNFGDGTSSRFAEPSHVYAGSGAYFITLFVRDTLGGCTAYFEDWITVVKPHPSGCQRFIRDTIAPSFTTGIDVITLLDYSTGCPPSGYIMDMAGARYWPDGNWSNIGGWRHARFLNRGRFPAYDSVPGVGWVDRGQSAYQSRPYAYTSAKNYGDCSANYEFDVVSEDSTGQQILFTAMNQSAASYSWYISGFGQPILSSADTVSQFFPFLSNYPDGVIYTVGLYTVGQNGCSDTLHQHIFITPSTTLSARGQRPALANAHPNPFSNHFVIQFDSNAEPATVTLFNSTGQMVWMQEGVANGQALIARNNLPAGLYYFSIRSASRHSTGKVIAQ